MVMISAGNDTVHNVVGGGDVKNVENSKYKTRHGVQELFTKNGSSCQIPNTVTLAAANVSIFRIILVAAATTHRHENSAGQTGFIQGLQASCSDLEFPKGVFSMSLDSLPLSGPLKFMSNP